MGLSKRRDDYMNHIAPGRQHFPRIGTGYFRLLKNNAGRAEDCLILDIDPAFAQLSHLHREDLLSQKTSIISKKYGLGTPSTWIICPAFSCLA